MKVAVIGANGKSGKLVVKESLSKGFETTAIVRNAKSITDKKISIINKDIASLTKDDLSGFDAIVNCFGTWTEETLPLHKKYEEHLCDLLSGTNTRLIVVGGAGSLYLNKEHTMQLFQSPEFPKEYLAIATSQVDELAYLRTRNDVKWTFFSPAAIFDPEGKRTGKYTLGGEEFIVNKANESYISYADYAIALIDEIKNAKFIQKRFTAVADKI
ncbi:hypothetical protein SAMN02910357_00316 [Succinivibrio dextrinosolvens]|uniref:NAD(P)-dependent oxidoreductase n=1 Tax=Succinivibrio dextrinosolvens TaxID=83771 RepID=UPI0008EB7050|nr:NAD(P)-dependent oxidoreductase [Succinivibrio dextrinosolvens]SFS36062.1 hypothetical protein SAMN02910357_00316 [Succinivibrio dextrinosolvens]